MSKERSFTQIERRNGITGLHVANPEGKEFFVYDRPLINVYKNKDNFVRIKRRDKKPDGKSRFYAGEIYASIRTNQMDGDRNIILTLFFGPAEKSLKLDKESGLLEGVIDRQEHLFPEDEFSTFIKAMEIMVEQHAEYTMIMDNVDVVCSL